MLVRTRPEWKHVANKLANSRDLHGHHVIGWDWETLDKSWPDVTPVGFSVAWYEPTPFGVEYHGAYVPVGHNTGELHLRLKDVLPEFKALMEDESVEKVAHNAKYDLKVSALAGIRTSENNITDTLLLSWLLNTNGVGTKLQVLQGEGTHGLKALSKHLLGYEMTELTDIAKKESYVRDGVEFETLRVDLVSLDVMGDYAGDDAVQVLKLRDHFRPQLDADPATKKVYEVIQRPFMFAIADMEMFGVELDVELLKDLRAKVEAELLLIKERMYGQRVGQDFDRIVDAALVQKAAEQWDALEARYALPKDHPNYPKYPVTKGRGANKTTVMQPMGKGSARKKLLDTFFPGGHPVIDKIRDDKLRPEVRRFPHLAHKVFNPASVDVLNTILFDEQGLAPIGERGANGLFSTKAEYVDTWKNLGDPMALELSRLREIDKLLGTYLIGMVARTSADGRLRGRINQGGTRTGRVSMADPNLQNQPKSSEFPIRQAFVATGLTACEVVIHEWHLDDKGRPTKPKHLTVTALPPEHPKHRAWTAKTGKVLDGGYEIRDGWVVRWWGSAPPMVLFVGDYSQLEICLLAHESNDPKLVRAVIEQQDIHALTAQAVFDAVPKDISLDEVKKSYGKYRSDAKPVNFGILYGMGPQKLAGTLGITVDEAKEIIENRYMGFYTGVKRWIERKHEFVTTNGYVKTAVGRKRHLPAAQLDKWGETFGIPNRQLISKAKRQAQNTPIQGLAADLVALAQRDVRQRFKEVTLSDLADVGVLSGENGEMPGHDGPLWGELVRMLLQVHDELVQEAHPAVANWVRKESVQMMENAGGITLRVPIRVDAALGTNWYLTKE